jgi:hypothetical protein
MLLDPIRDSELIIFPAEEPTPKETQSALCGGLSFLWLLHELEKGLD